MTYSISGKYIESDFVTNYFQKPKKALSQVLEQIRRVLRALPGQDKDFEIMLNTLEIKVPVNQRSWKRNSALIFYSKYQVQK